MNNQYFIYREELSDSEIRIKFNTKSNNWYYLNIFINDDKALVWFEHELFKTKKTNLFEHVEVFNRISGILLDYINSNSKIKQYSFGTKNKTFLKIIEQIFKNHGYAKNYKLINYRLISC